MKGAFMRELVAYVICAIVILYGIRESIGTAFEERTLKYSLYKVLYYFSILLTFFLVIVNLNLVMTIIIRFKLQYLTFIYNTKYTNSIILIIFFCISQNIIYVLLKLLSQPVLSSFKSSEKRAIPLCIISGFLGFIKGLVIILIAFVGVITYNRTLGDNNKIDLFNDFLAYDRIKTIIFTETSFKNDMHPVNDNTISTANNIIYYNGVTLEEGIQSNEEIDNKAKEIIKFCEDDRSKAKRIYTWIGTNIQYDSEKASKALNEEELNGSGSIAAWCNGKGICFDYACLYVSMARAVGLKVRLVTGEAFDGNSYGPHAWNQVYLTDEEKWINVDTTFYISGDYFDSNLFDEDHIEEEIAGEW